MLTVAIPYVAARAPAHPQFRLSFTTLGPCQTAQLGAARQRPPFVLRSASGGDLLEKRRLAREDDSDAIFKAGHSRQEGRGRSPPFVGAPILQAPNGSTTITPCLDNGLFGAKIDFGGVWIRGFGRGSTKDARVRSCCWACAGWGRFSCTA